MLRTSHKGKDIYLIFDVGKTHKKMLLYDKRFRVVKEESSAFPTTLDEDGFEADDVHYISQWVLDKVAAISADPQWKLQGINFTGYGATLVHLDIDGKPVCTMYNYLKPMEPHVVQGFYNLFGGAEKFSVQTSSPPMGMLNAGFQLYWLKYHRSELFRKIHRSLFLPQYLSFLLTGRQCTDLTSIGCHTGLWNFGDEDFHSWVYDEWMQNVLAPISQETVAGYVDIRGRQVPVGIGLHDSSASLLPYLYMSEEPFILVSTGTWAVTMNPFNRSPLTADELVNDVLVYMLPNGDPVKSSRVFMGMEHNVQGQRIARKFYLPQYFFENMNWDETLYEEIRKEPNDFIPSANGEWDFSGYGNGVSAYYALMRGLVNLLIKSFRRVDMAGINTVFVDGGFARNQVFMQMLKKKLSNKRIISSTVPESTAFGSLIYLLQPERIVLPDDAFIL